VLNSDDEWESSDQQQSLSSPAGAELGPAQLRLLFGLHVLCTSTPHDEETYT